MPEPKMKRKQPQPEFDPEQVRTISETVYRDRLGEADAAAMIAKDGDNGSTAALITYFRPLALITVIGQASD